MQVRIFFFVDGDVELNPDFIMEALNILNSGRADIVTGQLSEVYYESGYSGVIRYVEDRFSINEEKSVYSSGGCFIVRAPLIETVGFWDERMVRNQDIEFTLRLSRHGRFLAIPISMGTHHTLLYCDRPKLLKWYYSTYWGMLLRKNIDRPNVVIDLLLSNRGMLLGFIFNIIFALSFILCLTITSFYFMFYVLFVILFLDVTYSLLMNKKILWQLKVHFINPPIIIFGLLFPLKHKVFNNKVLKIK